MHAQFWLLECVANSLLRETSLKQRTGLARRRSRLGLGIGTRGHSSSLRGFGGWKNLRAQEPCLHPGIPAEYGKRGTLFFSIPRMLLHPG